MLGTGFPRRPGTPAPSYDAADDDGAAALKPAGVPLLAGTDAGNPGTTHGISLHASSSCSCRPGSRPPKPWPPPPALRRRIFRLGDRGRIAQGLRADLVLVYRRPDLRHHRDPRHRRGVEAWAVASIATASRRRSPPTMPPRTQRARRRGSESGLVSDFDDGTTAATFGAGWMVSTDAMANGKSSAEMTVVDGGADGSAKSLGITGTISAALPYAWAGAMFSPGEQPMSPVNLSSKKELRFWAQGDGKTYRVLHLRREQGIHAAHADLCRRAGVEGILTLPFSAFGGIDGHDLMASIFAGGPAAGPILVPDRRRARFR